MTISTLDELDASIKAYLDTKFATLDAAIVTYLSALETESSAATRYAAIIAALGTTESNITAGVSQSETAITSSVGQIDSGVQDAQALLLSVGSSAPAKRERYGVKANGP